MKKLLVVIAASLMYLSATGQQPIINPIPNINLKAKVRWVCSIENLGTPNLIIKANVKAEPGKNEQITINANLDLERIEFYSYTNQLAITIGVVGSGNVFKNYTFDFSGVNGYVRNKSIKVLCYLKGSTLPDASIIVMPLITFN